MHGIGNDYVYIDCLEQTVANPAELARLVSDRHFGIGSDGLILICPSDKADVRMRIFNADGSEAEMCGNGIRCAAKYVYERKLAKSAGPLTLANQAVFDASLRIETGRGVLTVGLAADQQDKVEKVCVNMGEPILEPDKIPVGLSSERVIEEPIEVLGQSLKMTCVSMGNPHAVFFCSDVDSVELEKLGPEIENHRLFPNRTNVHFVQVVGPAEMRIRTWERGSGMTLACGTGACACCVAGVLTGRCERTCTAHLPGGELELNWSEQDNRVYMTGQAVEVFEGTSPNS